MMTIMGKWHTLLFKLILYCGFSEGHIQIHAIDITDTWTFTPVLNYDYMSIAGNFPVRI